ncbi:MAG TPA: amidohydrolase family protein [Opitutaceae bacterium]|nr:amidohydrolase family protein [Opitutaceae bacterium]HND60692.1 amidohydrolase family protein [Opitutaceae bacterium]
MTFSDVAAIDSHAHFGRYLHADPLIGEFSSGAAEEITERARRCGIEWTIASPLDGLLPRGRGQDVVAANDAAFALVPRVKGLLQYVVVNPLQPKTYDQARRMLQAPWCVGIKIHPEEHDYRISDHGEELFRFFEEVGAAVMTHSGCPNSLPAAFVPFADAHPGARVLLAHLGNGAGANGRVDLQVRAVQAAKHGNLWVDTSSARSILPRLVEWAVRELGPERLLFGSDTPLYHVALQRTRIEVAEIPAEAKRLIFRENARRFFRLDRLPATFSP